MPEPEKDELDELLDNLSATSTDDNDDEEEPQGDDTGDDQGEGEGDQGAAPSPDPTTARYEGQYRQTELQGDDRQKMIDRVAEAFTSFDPAQQAAAIVDLIEERSSEKARGMMDNYLEARAHTAEDQVEAIAQRNMFRAARENPAILRDPRAAEIARLSAAFEIGAKSNNPEDIYTLLDGIISKRRGTIAQRVAGARTDNNNTPPRRQENQQPPPHQQMPSNSGGAPVSGRRATVNTQIKNALPGVDQGTLDAVFGRS